MPSAGPLGGKVRRDSYRLLRSTAVHPLDYTRRRRRDRFGQGALGQGSSRCRIDATCGCGGNVPIGAQSMLTTRAGCRAGGGLRWISESLPSWTRPRRRRELATRTSADGAVWVS